MNELYVSNNFADEYIKALKILTPREIEVLEKVARGHTSKEIGEELFISKKTVQKHREIVCKKLEIQGYRGLFFWCKDFHPDG